MKIMILAIFTLGLGGMCSQNIDNTTRPKHKTPLTFHSLWQIGVEDGPEEEMFGASLTLAVARTGDIYILDSSNFRVLHYDSDRHFLGSFGKQGQGPGEFQAPSEIAAAPDGTVWIFDSMAKQISIFDSRGVWKENRKLPQSVVAVIKPQILESGILLLSTVKLDTNYQQSYILGTMGKEVSSFSPLMSMPTPKVDWSTMNQPGFWEIFLENHFSAIAKGFPVAVAFDQTIVRFNTSSYEGIAVDEKGEELWTMTKTYKPVPLSEEAKRASCEEIFEGMKTGGPMGNVLTDAVFNSAFRKAELPDFMHPITGLFPWDHGFGILTNYDLITHEGNIDLFDKKGEFQYSGPYKGLKNISNIQNGKLYTYGLEDDIMKVSCLQVNMEGQE